MKQSPEGISYDGEDLLLQLRSFLVLSLSGRHFAGS